MANATLIVRSPAGEVNLSEYLNVQPGEGMEPGDPTFTTKVFAHSLLKQGATLALESFKEREMVFPLLLKGKSKAALTKLAQEINLVINSEGAQVEWLDAGATEPTFFDLASGQFDDEFNFRRGENSQPILAGKLRLFCQPFGYYSKNGPRALYVAGGKGTTVTTGTMPIVVFQATGAIRGDAPALLQVQLVEENWGSTQRDAYWAVAVLPNASYVPFIPAATICAGVGASFLHETLAPQGTAAHFVPVNEEAFLGEWNANATAAMPYVGRQRLLLAVRTPSHGNVQPVQCINGPNESLGYATPMATSAWHLLDLGVAANSSAAIAYGQDYQLRIEGSEVAGSAAIDIGGLIQLPDTNTTFLSVTSNLTKNRPKNVAFDGVTNGIWGALNIGVPASGLGASARGTLYNYAGVARGALPQFTPKGEPPVIAVLSAEALHSMNSGPVSVNVNVLERCRYVF